MSKTDFFELPEGDQHRECIEVETDYDRGVMDERKRWESKTCLSCYHSTALNVNLRRCDCVFLVDDYGDPTSIVPKDFLCAYYEPKGSE